jgi:hypothetical protein
MRRILSLTCAAGLVSLLAACSTLESNALSQEVGSGTSTPRAKAQRLGPAMWPTPKVFGGQYFRQPAPSELASSAGR